MGRRLDEDGVELLLGEHLLVVLVELPLLTAGNGLGGLVAAGEIAIGTGDHLRAGEGLAGQDPPRPASQADEAELDPIVGSGPARRRQGVCRRSGWGRRTSMRSRPRRSRGAIGDGSWNTPSR